MDPWNQDSGLDGDDFVEGVDDEDDEELGIDYTARHGGAMPMEDDPTPSPPISPRPPAHTRTPDARHMLANVASGNGAGRKFRVRPMSAKMAARSPDVVSILITKTNGSQVLLVKNGR